MKNIFLIVSLLSLIFADIEISGDARIRPRLDNVDDGGDIESSDLYYLYRARLNVKADIGLKEKHISILLDMPIGSVGTNFQRAVSKWLKE